MNFVLTWAAFFFGGLAVFALLVGFMYVVSILPEWVVVSCLFLVILLAITYGIARDWEVKK